MSDLAIVGGTVVIPGQEPRLADLSVVGERIAGIHEPGQVGDALETIDATGLHVFPGAIDPHIHLGGYQPLDVDTEPGTALAALGGVTTLVNYFKKTDSYLDMVPVYIEMYERDAYVDSAFHLQLLTQPHLDELEEVSRRFGVTSYKINLVWKGREKAVYDSDRPIDSGWVWSVMEEMARIDSDKMVLNVHCENQELKNEAKLRIADEMTPDLRFYERLAPDFSETESVLSVMLLAQETGASAYMVHLSSALTMEALKLPLADNPRVWGETCSHYLMHTYDSPAGLRATVSPPIRSQADQDALWEALADGRLEAVGSDSNPILEANKMGDDGFWGIKPGFEGVGAIVPSLLTGGYHQRGIPLGRIAQIMAESPAKIFGLYPQKGTIAPGSDADLVLVDLEEEYVAGDEMTGDHSDFSIFEGMTFKGKPKLTMLRGQVIARDGRIVGTRGRGRYLPRDL